MSHVKSNCQMLIGVGAATALLAAGAIAATTAPAVGADAAVAISDVALASSAVLDDAAGAAQAFDIAGAAEAFDISGLFNAELSAIEGLFSTIVSIPGTVISDVEHAISALGDLNVGMAFSSLASVPEDIALYLVSVPVAVATTAYEMVAVIPGEFLFNFGS